MVEAGIDDAELDDSGMIDSGMVDAGMVEACMVKASADLEDAAERLLEDSIGSLTWLQADVLEELRKRANGLVDLSAGCAGWRGRAISPRIQARLADFAGLLKASRENLEALERASCRDAGGFEPYGFFERIGLYEDSLMGNGATGRTGPEPARAAASRGVAGSGRNGRSRESVMERLHR